jgi:hypothetical protein
MVRVESVDGSGPSSYQLTDREFELVRKFQCRTVFTVSNSNNVTVYLENLVKLGCSVGFDICHYAQITYPTPEPMSYARHTYNDPHA